MISIIGILMEQPMDAAQAHQQGLDRWTGEPLNKINKLSAADIAEEKMRAQRLTNLKNTEIQTPTFNVQKELADSKARELASQGEIQAKNKVEEIRQGLHKEYDAAEAAQAKTKTVKNAIKNVATEQPGIAKKTSAMEDLGSAVKKTGSAIQKGAEGAVDTAKKGISHVGRAIAENPGPTAGVVGAGLAAGYLGKKLFGKPATARA